MRDFVFLISLVNSQVIKTFDLGISLNVPFLREKSPVFTLEDFRSQHFLNTVVFTVSFIFRSMVLKQTCIVRLLNF